MSFNECSNLIMSYKPMLSKEHTFFDYVYSKISRDTKNRFVEKGEGYIDILPFNSDGIRVIPLWKNISVDNLNVRDEVKTATSIIKNGAINQVYLVYPKNKEFRKHIQIKINELEELEQEYKIKLIPYSLNSLLKRGREND